MQRPDKISVTMPPDQRATRLDAIKDRVHRSISDPRRDVSDEEFDARLEALIGEDARDD